MPANEYDKSIPFDVHLWSDDERAKKVCQQVLEIIRPDIEHGYIRHTKKYDATLQAMVLSLILCHEDKNKHWVGISLNKNSYKANSRYNKLRIGYRPVKNIFNAMITHDLLDLQKGFHDSQTGKGRNTRIGMTPRFVDLLYPSNGRIKTFRDIELVQLRGKKLKVGDRKVAPLIEYHDTYETIRMRNVLEVLNKGFMKVEIVPGLTDRQEVKQAKYLKQRVNYDRKYVYRVFNEDFDRGGRFYGPWWQGCIKAYRQFILINGCRTVELDYASLHPRMLHHRQGSVSPAGDLYLIGDAEEHRSLCKIIFNCLLNASTTEKAVSAVRYEFNVERRQPHLINGIDLNGLADKLKAKHEPIAEFLGSGIGVELQYLDSCIAERVMLDLHGLGIVALPVHDSFIVAEQYESMLREAMMEAYFVEVGHYPLIG